MPSASCQHVLYAIADVMRVRTRKQRTAHHDFERAFIPSVESQQAGDQGRAAFGFPDAGNVARHFQFQFRMPLLPTLHRAPKSSGRRPMCHGMERPDGGLVAEMRRSVDGEHPVRRLRTRAAPAGVSVDQGPAEAAEDEGSAKAYATGMRAPRGRQRQRQHERTALQWRGKTTQSIPVPGWFGCFAVCVQLSVRAQAWLPCARAIRVRAPAGRQAGGCHWQPVSTGMSPQTC